MSASRRLDWIIFGLRWLLVAGALIVLLGGNTTALSAATLPQGLTIGIILAAAYNLIVAVFLLASLSGSTLQRLTLVGDSLLAVMFFGVSNASPVILVGMGLFPIIIASLRYGRTSGIITAAMIAILSALLLVITGGMGNSAPSLLIGILFLFLTAALTSVISVEMKEPSRRPMTTTQQEIESSRLRAERERARAIYEMANTLSANLDYHKVLDAALDVGVLGLKDIGQGVRLVGMVMLFQNDEHKALQVATSRRLTRADEKVIVPGVRGVLGLALKQAEPVFFNDATRDPELNHFAAFQELKSILAIPLRANYESYGVLVFGLQQPDAFSDDHIELMTAIGTQATIALQNAVLYENVRREKERIVEVEEDARKKLARDLHDGPTQVVSAIAMRINYIRKLIERNQTATVNEELQKVEELARNTTREIRHMLFTLRPLVLETQGLTPALMQFVEKMKETHNLDVILQAQSGVDSLIDSHAQGVLFYIIEEAVNNARKHAQAQHIYVRLYRHEAYFVAEIQDDGVGFDSVAVDAGYDKRGSLGMVNMRERAQLVEGRLTLESVIGQGTKITVMIALREAPHMATPAQPPSTNGGNGHTTSGTQLKEATNPKRPAGLPRTSPKTP